MALSENARGALLMTGSMGCFVLNDTLMKVAFESVPVAQTLFFRGVFASLMLIAMAVHTGAIRYKPTRDDVKPFILRAIGEVGATASFMMALYNMEIANAMAVLQAAPLAVTVGAALFLGERVRWRRWSAIGVGFIGMLVIVRPGTEGFDAYALFAVLSVIFIAIRDLATHEMSRDVPTVFASVISALLVTVGAGVLIPIEGWAPMGGSDTLHIFGAGVAIVIGYVTSVSAMRMGEVSAVSPFRYTVLLWALLWGFLFFHTLPDAMTFLGAGIVVAAGLYTLWRERSVGQSTATYASNRPFDGSPPMGQTVIDKPAERPMDSR